MRCVTEVEADSWEKGGRSKRVVLFLLPFYPGLGSLLCVKMILLAFFMTEINNIKSGGVYYFWPLDDVIKYV